MSPDPITFSCTSQMPVQVEYFFFIFAPYQLLAAYREKLFFMISSMETEESMSHQLVEGFYRELSMSMMKGQL